VAPAAAGADVEVKSVLLKLIERVETPARDTGMIIDLKVVEGQRVEADQLLAQIDDEEPRLLKIKTELELRVAEKKARDETGIKLAAEELEVADADFQRAQKARERLASSVPAMEFEHLKLKAVQAKLQLEKAQHDLEVARLTRDARTADIGIVEHNLARRRVVAPFAGQVVEILRRRGEWVEPGDKVVRVVRLDRLRAEGFLDLQYVRPELVGRPVTVRVEGVGGQPRTLTGKLLFVSPEADPVNRQTRVLAEVDNKDQLLPAGLRATMTIHAP
jgi:macrolide-specific efflux system membrane fusion protein